MKIRKNIKLVRYTTFHIGGPAKYFVEVNNVSELEKALAFSRKEKLKIFILGGGSNTLFSDKGFNGLVIKLNIKGLSFKDGVVSAGAGEIWDTIVAKAVKKGLAGIENLSLIPGTVGGAVYQNIGAYGVELKDILESVSVFNTKTDKIEKMIAKDCRFGYRDSIFQHPKGAKYIILGVDLKLSQKFSPNLKYPDLVEYFKRQPRGAEQWSNDHKKIPIAKRDRGSSIFNPNHFDLVKIGTTLLAVREAVIKIRKSKLVYPIPSMGTVGSFFKNPVITVIGYRLLVDKYPDIKGREAGKGFMKLSAGQLIEKSGLKGISLHNAGVSKRHALVLVSYKGAKAKDILKLSKNIQKSVKKEFGVILEPEVKIISF